MPTTDRHGNMTSLSEHFNLESEISLLQQQQPPKSGVASKMLFKDAHIRILLISLNAGAQMAEHHADGTISIQILRGAIQFQAQDKFQDKSQTLRTGELITLAPSIPHSVTAAEPAVFLLTLAWPTDPELRSLKHRGYGT
jgi:quercetin dioxygenase-like cupin family protein